MVGYALFSSCEDVLCIRKIEKKKLYPPSSPVEREPKREKSEFRAFSYCVRTQTLDVSQGKMEILLKNVKLFAYTKK